MPRSNFGLKPSSLGHVWGPYRQNLAFSCERNLTLLSSQNFCFNSEELNKAEGLPEFRCVPVSLDLPSGASCPNDVSARERSIIIADRVRTRLGLL